MRALDWLLDLLYPPKCVICRRLLARGEQDICPDCFESLPNFEGEKPQVGGAEGLSVTLFYEGAVRESFLRFKFSGRDFYADVYGNWMAGRIRDELGRGFDGVCWVPVSKKRRKSRGYDQSELLAKRVAKDLSLPTCAALRSTPSGTRSRSSKTRPFGRRTHPVRFPCGPMRMFPGKRFF